MSCFPFLCFAVFYVFSSRAAMSRAAMILL